ncbi:MAG: elongation factor Ts [Solobacterium sp.]|jgi:translation elongation factor Ts|uniref:translation elongation factor Ts n=1 Tax=uncultured Solobacterium sp. TaxID=747375 RepID=UPI001CAB3778|nr:translation elongation factor Ts [uncultured Solobacterium sp.]MBF1072559.1 elongation factor Ts [Solobacterium sp.]MBF1092636.1 elongation factor Ts [Solobacterium sp.]MBF1095947.1 elongation factor Ts [Solobacterium sp.]
MAITAAQVKELRELTGAGMMDCKKALTECEGDTKKAIDWLREKGIAKAAKKEGRIAAEGLAKILIEGNKAVVLEVNSETDFVAKNDRFLALLDEAAKTIFNSNAKTVEEALALPTAEGTLNDSFIGAVAVIGEKITLRRFEIVEKSDDELFGSYTHQGGRIVAVTVVKGTADAQVAKNMAMQVASMNPTYVSRNEMPQDVVAHEREVQEGIMANDPSLANKPEKVKAGIIEGRVSKSLQDMCLVDQEYFLDSSLKCGQYLKENNAEVVKFVKYIVGEGIEKKQDDFAAEVAAMAK